MSARAKILHSIRAGLWQPAKDAADIAAEAAALVADTDAVQPQPAHDDLVEQFVAKASSERVTATVDRIRGWSGIPAAIRKYLRETGRQGPMAVQPTEKLTALDWNGFDLTASLDADGGVSVTLAEWGIAETGTVAMRSDADAPILLNFLPLTHIIVLETGKILAHSEDLWPHLGGAGLDQPRLLTLITGTSGTADIEAINIRGAHGPKNMHIVLVDTA